MDANAIRQCICDVIAVVQSTSGLECPPLVGSTVPGRDVTDFKSEVWPVAISMIEDMTNIDIPNEENLFCDDVTKALLTVDQCVEKVIQIAKKEKKKEAVNG